MTFRRLTQGLACCALLVATASADTRAPTQGKIVSGFLVDAPWPGIAYLSGRAGAGMERFIRGGDDELNICTGTLISPTVVLTATHCVYGALLASRQLAFRVQAAQAGRRATTEEEVEFLLAERQSVRAEGFFDHRTRITVTIGGVRKDAGVDTVDAVAYRMHEDGFQALVDIQTNGALDALGASEHLREENLATGSDIALLYLERPADSTYAVLLPKDAPTLSTGARGVAVGFGANDREATSVDSRLRQLDMEVLAECDGSSCAAGVEFTAKSPQLGATPCRGDSGGPLYVALPEGGVGVGGVLSRFPLVGDFDPTLPCVGAQGMVYANVRQFFDWVETHKASYPDSGSCGCQTPTRGGAMSVFFVAAALLSSRRRRWRAARSR